MTKRLIINGTETRKAIRAIAKYISPDMEPIATVETTKKPTELLSGRYYPYIAVFVPVVTWGIRRGLRHGIFPLLANLKAFRTCSQNLFQARMRSGLREIL